jgi:hypothetical protein
MALNLRYGNGAVEQHSITVYRLGLEHTLATLPHLSAQLCPRSGASGLADVANNGEVRMVNDMGGLTTDICGLNLQYLPGRTRH